MCGSWAIFFVLVPLTGPAVENVGLPDGAREEFVIRYALYFFGILIYAVSMSLRVAARAVTTRNWLVLFLSIPSILAAAMVSVITIMMVCQYLVTLL